MTSQDPDHGTVEDSVECNMPGEPIAISFNGRFILDLLRHCHKDEIFLKCRENSPMLVQDKDQGDCVFVVTPMRTR